jgi:hypothetical protein
MTATCFVHTPSGQLAEGNMIWLSSGVFSTGWSLCFLLKSQTGINFIVRLFLSPNTSQWKKIGQHLSNKKVQPSDIEKGLICNSKKLAKRKRVTQTHPQYITNELPVFATNHVCFRSCLYQCRHVKSCVKALQ